MAFPVRAVVVSTVAGGFLWFIGFPKWAAFLFSFLGFLGMGGLQYGRIVYRTFPRDLWWALIWVVVYVVFYLYIRTGSNSKSEWLSHTSNFMYRMGGRLLKILKLMNRGLKENLYISDYFQDQVSKYPNKVAIIFEDRRITFKELDEASNRIANMLCSSTNLQHGDTMAIFMENSSEYVMILLALSKIGVTGAFINHNLRSDSLAHCIRIANCSGAFFGSNLADAMSEVLADLSINDMLYCVGDKCSLPQAKSLEAEIKMASTNSPLPVKGKTAKGCALG